MHHFLIHCSMLINIGFEYLTAVVVQIYTFWDMPRVEAGKNTSTVIPASRKWRRKGNRISLR
jgi:hypothetical protein